MEDYFNPSKISVREIEGGFAEDMIVKYHYSHKWSLCQVAYGVFYLTDNDSPFFDTKEEKLIGCMVFGQPVGRSAAESVSDLIKIDEVFELTRLFIFDGYGRNIESYCVSQAIHFIKRSFPNIKAIISYSDTEQNHSGIIYQAANFLFTGLNSDTNLMPNFSISLIGPPYKWIHSRSVFSKYGSHNISYLKKKIGHTFWRKKEAGKFRYVYIISDKKMKKEIMKTLKMRILPYPKICNYKENIEKIEVKDETENKFFT